jgi:hypothetical protein
MQTNPLSKTQRKQTSVKLAAIILVLSLLLMGSAGSAQAGSAITFNLVQEIPVVYSQFVPCAAGGAGEVLDFSGSIEEFIHGTLTGNGHATFSAKMVPNNLIGVGQVTGIAYRLVGETGTTRTYTIDFGPGEKWTGVEHLRFVAPGAGNDYVTMNVYHEIVNNNGELVSYLDLTTVECQ